MNNTTTTNVFSCTCVTFDAEAVEETTRCLVLVARDANHAESLALVHLLRHHDGHRVVHTVTARAATLVRDE